MKRHTRPEMRSQRLRLSTFPGCASDGGQPGSDGWWPLWKNPGTGPVLFTFCIRPWPFAHLAGGPADEQKVVWRTGHLPPAVCRPPLWLCCFSASLQNKGPLSSNEPNEPREGDQEAQSRPSRASRALLGQLICRALPLPIVTSSLVQHSVLSNKPKTAKKSRHQLAVQGSPMRKLRPRFGVWSTGSWFGGPQQLAALNSGTQF